MSRVKKKKLRKLGIHSKSERRRARKYILSFPKCNRGYGYNNIACNMNLLDTFREFSSKITKNKQ